MMKVRCALMRRAQRPDGVGRNLGHARGPFGGFGDAIALAHDIGAEARKAGRIAFDKGTVEKIFGDQRVGDAEHQRDVGIGTQGHPFGIEFVRVYRRVSD